MAAAIWLMIFALVFGVLKYGFARVVQGKTKEQLELDALKKEYIELIANNSIFKSKAKKENEIEQMEVRIYELEKRLNNN
jgi:hypothetical protein